MTERGYTESLKAEFDMEIQSEVFRFNRTLLIEGRTYEYHNKYNDGVSNKEKLKIYFTHIFQMNLLKMQLLHLNI